MGAASRVDVMEALARDKGRLRSIVAEAVSRRRAPDLVFEVAPPLDEVDPWEP
jgi:ribosome-binding factor A